MTNLPTYKALIEEGWEHIHNCDTNRADSFIVELSIGSTAQFCIGEPHDDMGDFTLILIGLGMVGIYRSGGRHSNLDRFDSLPSSPAHMPEPEYKQRYEHTRPFDSKPVEIVT